MKRTEILTAAFIAKKNISKNKKTLLLTTLIIALGFISAIILYGVLKDTGYDLQENFIEMTIGHVVIEPYEDAEHLENYEEILRKIRTIPGTENIATVKKRPLTLQNREGETIRTQVYIVRPEDYKKTSQVDDNIVEGEWLNKGEAGKIVMGCILLKHCNPTEEYKRINLHLGEPVTLFSEEGTSLHVSLQGIYKHTFTDLELIPYITEATAQQIYPDYDETTTDQIIIRLANREQTREVIRQLETLTLNAKIVSWEEKLVGFSSIIDSFSIIGNLSFVIGIIISAISVYIVLYINILHKRTQIGIIKAIGIQSRVVELSYLLLSLFIAVIGTIGGIILTQLMILYFTFNPLHTGIGSLVPQVTFQVFLVVSLAIIFTSALTGYLVSKQITKQNIITAITNG